MHKSNFQRSLLVPHYCMLYSLQQQSISYHPEHVIWKLSVLCYSLKRCSTEEIQKLGWKYNIFSEWNVEIENYFLLNNHEVLITAPYKKCKCGFFRRTWSVSYRMWLKKKKKELKGVIVLRTHTHDTLSISFFSKAAFNLLNFVIVINLMVSLQAVPNLSKNCLFAPKAFLFSCSKWNTYLL